jgi:phosphatidylglycerol:prolipoprotein diacylglycerol transferase
VFAGVLAALVIGLRRAKEAELSPRSLLPIWTSSVIAGFLGARLAFFLQCGGAPMRGGFVLYGGLVAGVFTALAACRLKGLPALKVADLTIPCVFLAASFGRFGCLLAGCCHGAVCNGGLCYPPGSHPFRAQVESGILEAGAAESLPTAPVVLFEALALLVLSGFLSVLWRRRPAPGNVFIAAGILYPAWRFCAEFWRADNKHYWPGGLTFSQGISLAVIALSLVFWLLRDRQIRRQPLSAAGDRCVGVGQVIAFVASVIVSLGGVNCSSHKSQDEEHTVEGVHAYRKPAGGAAATPAPQGQNSGKPERKESKQKEDKDDSDGWFADCISDCTSSCIDQCCDAACGGDSSCGSGASSGNQAAEEPGDVSQKGILGVLRPGKKYDGIIEVEAVANGKLSIHLKLQGVLTADKGQGDGSRPIHLRLSSIDLTVGGKRWSGSGDVDLETSPSLTAKVVRSTLPEDLMQALGSLNLVGGSLLQLPPSDSVIPELKDRIASELRIDNPRLGCSGTTRFGGVERNFLGDARITDDPSGVRTIFWTLKY